MSDQLHVLPDVELIIKEHLKALLFVRGEQCTAGLGVPGDWTTASPDHIQVISAIDTVTKGWGRVAPISGDGPTQITAWSRDASSAKRLANLCLGLLMVGRPPAGLTALTPITGVSTTVDRRTRGELAFFKVRATALTIPA